MIKLKIGVIFGGVSLEHEISLKSAYSVIKSLKESSNYDVYPIGITKNGGWFYYFGDVEKIKTGEWEQDSKFNLLLNIDFKNRCVVEIDSNLKSSVLEIDCFFPVLHGRNGEDGKVASVFEMMDVPYVGCNPLSGALCMNKILTRTVLDYNNILGTKWKSLTINDIANLDEKISTIAEFLSFPIFTKPASSGSSVGVVRCENLKELKKGVLFAFEYDDELICEAFVDGQEVECAVLGGDDPKASVVGEIKSFGKFYDYDSKYQKESKLIIPANLKRETCEKVQQIAINVFKIMRCYGLARVDFFVDVHDKIFLNEVNTMPGFTEISMYKMLWEKTNLSYSELLKELISLALKRKRENNEIKKINEQREKDGSFH